jgi:ribonuclease P protein component
MVLWLRAGEGASLRLGVISSKKLHLRANKRNLARRRMREAYRHLRPYFSGDFDVILVGRRAILTAEWKDILKELLKLAHKSGIITPENLERAKADLLDSDSTKRNNCSE